MDPQPRRKGRETLLSVVFVVILGGVLFFFLNLVSMGIFSHVSAAIVGIVILGYIHYVVWGHSMSEEVAGERAIDKLNEEMEAEGEHHYDERVRRHRDGY